MFFHALTFAGSLGCCLNTRPSVQISSEGPDKCYCNETYMCNLYSCMVYLIPTQFALKTQLKHSIVHFLTLDFSKQNGVGCVLSNAITTS